MQNTPKTIEEEILFTEFLLKEKLMPNSNTEEYLKGINRFYFKKLSEQDRISRDSVISQIHKASIWKLVPNTPRMIMCSDKDLKNFLQTLTKE